MKQILIILLLSVNLNIAFGQIHFKPQHKEITLGDSVKLEWSIEKLKRKTVVSIENLLDSVDSRGYIYVSPTKTTYYRLYITTKGKIKKKTCKVKVLEPEFIKFRTVNRHNTDEDSVSIVWDVANAEYVVFNGEKKHYNTSDTNVVFLDSTSTISITAYNKNNIYTTKAIKVDIENVEYLKCKNEIYLRDTLFINWQYKYTKYVTVKGFSQEFEAKDKVFFVPNNNTEVKLFIFHNNGDTIVETIAVKVKSPLIKFDIPAIVYKGWTPYLVWDVKEGFDFEITGLDNAILSTNSGKVEVGLNTNPYIITVKDKKGIIVARDTASIKSVLSPIKQFLVPKESVAGFPEQLSWKLKKGFTGEIVDVKYNIKGDGQESIVPFDNKTYTFVAFFNGMPVDTVEKSMNVIKLRTYVKQAKHISELPDDTKINFEIFSVDESNYPEEVKLYLLAVDSSGNFVSGLEEMGKKRKKSVINNVFESSGKRYKKINSFDFKEHHTPSSLPYNISLALDYSGSMCQNTTYMTSAVKEFIKSKGVNDSISISLFSDELESICVLENNTDSLLSFIDSIVPPWGSTALYAGSDFALQSIPKAASNKVLIIFTDGCENSSFKYFGKYAYTATQVAKLARDNNITIHVIGYGYGVNNSILYNLAKLTGGNYYNISNTEEISSIFTELPIVFRNYYEISYKPNVKKGYNTVLVKYDNLQDEIIETETEYQAGDIVEIDEFIPGKVTYWKREAVINKKIPVTTPQVLTLFDFDKYVLDSLAITSIGMYIKLLKEKPEMSAFIFGHTDSKGKDEYCDKLSLKRAESVKSFIVEFGDIDPDRLFVTGCGQSERIWNDDSIDWKAHENRRIEIVLAR